MQKLEIKVGHEYALREARSPNAAMQHVRILQHIRRGNWKAEWIAPNAGLVDYVESKNLIVLWKDRKPFLRDEESERQLRSDNERGGYIRDSPVDNAVTSVFESVGERELSFYRGALSSPPDALERIKQRANVVADRTWPHSYVDRHGTVHLPFAGALDLAKAFCSSEPATVLAGVEATEREWSIKAAQPSGEYLVGLLNQYRAAWALIRQWAGHDAAVAQREIQIQRLERLVWDAVYALQKAGLDKEAQTLRRALQRD